MGLTQNFYAPIHIDSYIQSNDDYIRNPQHVEIVKALGKFANRTVQREFYLTVNLLVASIRKDYELNAWLYREVYGEEPDEDIVDCGFSATLSQETLISALQYVRSRTEHRGTMKGQASIDALSMAITWCIANGYVFVNYVAS